MTQKTSPGGISRLYHQLDSVFTEKEAWFLFKWSAFLETIGWTALIIGIVFQITKWPGQSWLLPIGGSLHGTFVIIYMLIVLFAHRSLGWSIKRFIIAELINAVPYGALIFELYVAKEREKACTLGMKHPPRT